jgi:membrane protease YdiL (CAAX protease family)
MLKQPVSFWRNHSVLLYGLSFCIFVFLLLLRESPSYGHIYNFLPILGRTTPYIILTLLVTTVYKLSGNRLQDIGFSWPNWGHSHRKTLMLLLLAAVLILGARILSIIPTGWLFEQLNLHASATRPTDLLVGNLSLLLFILPIMWLAVTSEEILIRGFLMNALANRLGGTRRDWLFAIVISSIIFGLGHFPNGLRGMIGSGIGGLIYGLSYYLGKRNLLPVIFAHAASNTLAFVSAYASD